MEQNLIIAGIISLVLTIMIISVSRSGNKDLAKNSTQGHVKKGLKIPSIGITDRALIAREAINYFPYEEFEAVVDLLQGQGEKRKAIEELHLKIRVNYENFLFEAIGEEFDHNSYKDEIDEEVEKIMQLGIRGILKKYGTDSINESVEDVSREIKSSESWDEIKRRL
jgi:hypothetical protein